VWVTEDSYLFVETEEPQSGYFTVQYSVENRGKCCRFLVLFTLLHYHASWFV